MNRAATQGHYDIAWGLFSELRKELVETQKTRIQIIGFKITFVSAALDVTAANLHKVGTFFGAESILERMDLSKEDEHA